MERIAALVGDDVLRITDMGSAWPALGDLTVEDEVVPVALFTGSVNLGGRYRDDIERRFQNPGDRSPITDPRPARAPLLLGFYEDDPYATVLRPLLVSTDAVRRIGLRTRFSVFVSVESIVQAQLRGWSTQVSGSGELMRCFVPSLLPLSVAADRDGVEPSQAEVRAAITASGLLAATHDEAAAAAQRTRLAVTVALRDRRFSHRVRDAYGRRCAMCGLGAGLVQGAHVYPVSAPGSADEPWNGLALCGNHHLAFDSHLVAVLPPTGEIAFHPSLLAGAVDDAALQSLIDATFERVALPSDPLATLRPEMLERRYEYFPAEYAWLR